MSLDQVLAIELQNINLNAAVSAAVLKQNAKRAEDKVLHQLFARMAKARQMLADAAEHDLDKIELPRSKVAEVVDEVEADIDKRMRQASQDEALLQAALKQDQKLHRCIKRFVRHQPTTPIAEYILWIEADIGRIKTELLH